MLSSLLEQTLHYISYTTNIPEFSMIKSDSRVSLESSIVIQRNRIFNVLLTTPMLYRNFGEHILFASFYANINLIQCIALSITRYNVIKKYFITKKIIPLWYFQFYTQTIEKISQSQQSHT